jgi:hypothetical protein
MTDILTNTFAELTDNGSTASVELPGDVNEVDVYIDDGETWDSGSLTALTSFDGGTTWVTVPGFTKTTGDGYLGSFTAYGKDLKFTIASVAGASASITITIKAKRVMSQVILAAQTLTDNGNTDLVLTRPGDLAVFAKGTWDSGSLTLSVSPDGTLYVDSGVTAITANGGGYYTNTAGDTTLRLVLASVAGAAADLDVWVYVKYAE